MATCKAIMSYNEEYDDNIVEKYVIECTPAELLLLNKVIAKTVSREPLELDDEDVDIILSDINKAIKKTQYYEKVEMFTDGSCEGNPGPGGWGTILRIGTQEKEFSGGAVDTTNNRMELTGVIEGLKMIKRPCQITLYSDSKYVVDAIQKGWAEKWKSAGQLDTLIPTRKNADLWNELLTLIKPHKFKAVWVKGHAGHPENERCDKLANEAALKYLNYKEEMQL